MGLHTSLLVRSVRSRPRRKEILSKNNLNMAKARMRRSLRIVRGHLPRRLQQKSYIVTKSIRTNPAHTDSLGGGNITGRPPERSRPHSVSVASTTWSRTSARTVEDHRCVCTTVSFDSVSTAEVPIAVVLAASTTRCQVSGRNVEDPICASTSAKSTSARIALTILRQQRNAMFNLFSFSFLFVFCFLFSFFFPTPAPVCGT